MWWKLHLGLINTQNLISSSLPQSSLLTLPNWESRFCLVLWSLHYFSLFCCALPSHLSNCFEDLCRWVFRLKFSSFVGQSSGTGRLWLDSCWCNGWPFCSKYHNWTSCRWCSTPCDRSSFRCAFGMLLSHFDSLWCWQWFLSTSININSKHYRWLWSLSSVCQTL